MKNNNLFYIINALLVIVVGVILGVAYGNTLFNNGVCVSAYICLIVALCLPSLIYINQKKLKVGGLIATILFASVEVIYSVIALFIPAIGLQLFWIIQAGVIGAFLISGLLIVVSYSKNK